MTTKDEDVKVVQLEADVMNIQIQSDGKTVDGTSIMVNGTKIEDVQWVSFNVNRYGEGVSLTVEQKVTDDATGLSKIERLEYRSDAKEDEAEDAPTMASIRGARVPLESLESIRRTKEE